MPQVILNMSDDMIVRLNELAKRKGTTRELLVTKIVREKMMKDRDNVEEDKARTDRTSRKRRT